MDPREMKTYTLWMESNRDMDGLIATKMNHDAHFLKVNCKYCRRPLKVDVSLDEQNAANMDVDHGQKKDVECFKNCRKPKALRYVRIEGSEVRVLPSSRADDAILLGPNALRITLYGLRLEAIRTRGSWHILDHGVVFTPGDEVGLNLSEGRIKPTLIPKVILL